MHNLVQMFVAFQSAPVDMSKYMESSEFRVNSLLSALFAVAYRT